MFLVKNTLIHGLTCLLSTNDLQPLIKYLKELTESEIAQIRIPGNNVGWFPLADILEASATEAGERQYDSFSRAVAAGVMASGKSVDVPDVSVLTDRSESLDQNALKSFACFPLTSRQEVVGVLFIASRNYRAALRDELVQTLEQVAHALAAIVLREHWYEELLNKGVETNKSGQYGIVTGDEYMRHVISMLPRYAQTNAPVLVLGETGTGKERIAAALHSLSRRNDKPFVKVHCGAISEALIESELFGHEKGAFTGAVRTTDGYFGLADGGTIFLDEINTASPEVQVKLLRVLESGEIARVGSSRSRTTNVRIVVAGNQDLQEMVNRGTFRKDLYYRLKVLEIYLPPLRERPDDIPLLARYFLDHYTMLHEKHISGFSREALCCLQEQYWEGNIRQLKHLVEALVIHADANTIIARAHVQRILSSGRKNGSNGRADAHVQPYALSFKEFRSNHLNSVEREFLIHHLTSHDWSVADTARALDMARSTLIHRIKVLDIHKT